jgi:hypothetical protein
MQILVNTDDHIRGGVDTTEFVESVVQSSLDRFAARITRVEAYLSDQNSSKKGGSDDIRCVLEARVGGIQPIVVSHDAGAVDDAVTGAAGKLQRALGSALGKLN